MRRFFFRFVNLFRARGAEREMAREIESHLGLLQEEFERRGLTRRSASRALSAVRSFYRYLQVHHGVANGVARAARVPKLRLMASAARADNWQNSRLPW